MQAVQTLINGGSSYAVLLDHQAHARGRSCSIDGPCHVTDPHDEQLQQRSSDSIIEHSMLLSSATQAAKMFPAEIKPFNYEPPKLF